MTAGDKCWFPALAKYRNMFGEPGKTTGLRQYRIFGIVIMDTLMVLAFAYLLSLWNGYPFLTNALGMFVLGIIAHRIFCVRTAVDRFLFP